MKSGFERYLKALKFSKVRTLEDIIRFNDDHPDIEYSDGMQTTRDSYIRSNFILHSSLIRGSYRLLPKSGWSHRMSGTIQAR